MKMRQFLIAGTVIVILGLIAQGSDRPTIKEMEEAVDRLREFMPKLSELEDHFSSYPPALIGLAYIYQRYGPSPMYWDRSEYLYRKASKLDPKNKVAHAAFAKWVVLNFLSQRGRVMIDLDMLRQYDKSKNFQEVEIPSWSRLYEWLHEEGQERVVIRDFNEARARIFGKIDRDLPNVVSTLETAEKIESGNALYNYLRAQLHFERCKDDEGVIEVERGADKPYLSNHWIEIAAVCRGVLLDAGFPEHYLEIIENSHSSPGGLPSYDKLIEIAKQQEARQDFKKAAQIYEALIRMAEQVRQEPVPGGPAGKRGKNELSDRIEREAKLQLSKIQSHIKNEETK